MLGDDLIELLGERIPGDRAGQTVAEHELAAWLAAAPRAEGGAPRVLDLGCGAGHSVDRFRALEPDVRWVGVDIAESPEVSGRTRADAAFATFDGESLPFEDGSFDLVWCKQVLEHVRRPIGLIDEAARVLAPGGLFCGSTSQMEPFHSRSTQNPTPYGLTLTLRDAGLEVRELRPSIDSLTLIVRRAVGRRGSVFDRWWDRDSPLNRAISLYGRARGLDARSVNAAKLVLCGSFTFVAFKRG